MYFTDAYLGQCDNQDRIGPTDRFSLFKLLKQNKGNTGGYRDPHRTTAFL